MSHDSFNYHALRLRSSARGLGRYWRYHRLFSNGRSHRHRNWRNRLIGNRHGNRSRNWRNWHIGDRRGNRSHYWPNWHFYHRCGDWNSNWRNRLLIDHGRSNRSRLYGWPINDRRDLRRRRCDGSGNLCSHWRSLDHYMSRLTLRREGRRRHGPRNTGRLYRLDLSAIGFRLMSHDSFYNHALRLRGPARGIRRDGHYHRLFGYGRCKWNGNWSNRHFYHRHCNRSRRHGWPINNRRDLRRRRCDGSNNLRSRWRSLVDDMSRLTLRREWRLRHRTRNARHVNRLDLSAIGFRLMSHDSFYNHALRLCDLAGDLGRYWRSHRLFDRRRGKWSRNWPNRLIDHRRGSRHHNWPNWHFYHRCGNRNDNWRNRLLINHRRGIRSHLHGWLINNRRGSRNGNWRNRLIDHGGSNRSL